MDSADLSQMKIDTIAVLENANCARKNYGNELFPLIPIWAQKIIGINDFHYFRKVHSGMGEIFY